MIACFLTSLFGILVLPFLPIFLSGLLCLLTSSKLELLLERLLLLALFAP